MRMSTVTQLNKELKAEVERLQSELKKFGEQGDSAVKTGAQLAGHVVVGKLMQAMQKSKKVFMGLLEN